ncbi:MAG: hypothetical protein Q8K28_18960 [Hoeflea sp.]|uniref:hypothetical protein n=1 Tax=Hoeflea sp. TaxID=1940281 RepID=UPI00272F1F24|nr:hypothetical protein [Hoeflea sp.]MDP2121985.1 hypothetical protein [Hoeflea sp.]
MNKETRTRLIKKGAIWGFILFELVFFSIAGSFLSLSQGAFMDADNMLLLLKQSAPIGIIALGMTIIMINGNIDLIPSLIDQNPLAHFLRPMDMIFQGWFWSFLQEYEQWSTMSS